MFTSIPHTSHTKKPVILFCPQDNRLSYLFRWKSSSQCLLCTVDFLPLLLDLSACTILVKIACDIGLHDLEVTLYIRFDRRNNTCYICKPCLAIIRSIPLKPIWISGSMERTSASIHAPCPRTIAALPVPKADSSPSSAVSRGLSSPYFTARSMKSKKLL